MAGVLVLGCAPLHHQKVDAGVLKEKAIEGSWVGYDQDSPSFWRLTLSPSGRGSCVVLFFDGAFSVYGVSKWEVGADGLNLEFVPREDAERMKLKVGSVNEYVMQIDARGCERKWKHEILLYKAEELEPRIQLSEGIAARSESDPKR